MLQEVRNRKSFVLNFWTLATLLTLLVALSACSKSGKPAVTETAQETFAAPDDASKALVMAAKADDHNALLAVFGPGSSDLIFSGDAAQDKLTFEHFTAAYKTMNRWRKQTDGSEVLYVGADNNPFPIPLKKNSAGQWYFDTAAGKDEILSRRIGDNELAAMDVVAATADAQRQYFSQPHDGMKQYAQKFISEEGKQNGLYWPSPEGQPRSPLGPLLAYASAQGFQVKPDSHQPFYGYYFQMLDKQGPDAKGGAKNYIVNGKMTGGFAVLAYPAQYGDSGIMTFIINQNGIVFEKDLGKTTDQVAAQINEFNPDKSWRMVEE